MFFICPQSIVENYLEVGGRGIRVSVGHECKSGDWYVMKRLRRRVVSWTIGQWGIVQRAQLQIFPGRCRSRTVDGNCFYIYVG